MSELDKGKCVKDTQVHYKDICPVFISVGDVTRAVSHLIAGCLDLLADWEDIKKKPLKDIYSEIQTGYNGGISGKEFNCIYLAIGRFHYVVGISRVPVNDAGLVFEEV